ncbi:MAG: hypothetical protein ABF289_04920 [Clostridiales bacterium]
MTKHKRLFIETLIILSILILPILTKYNGLGIFVAIIYLFVERKLRNRTYKEIGLNKKKLLKDLKENWHLISLISILSTIVSIPITKIFLPEYLNHVIERVSPELSFNFIILLIIQLIFFSLGEEIAFRAFLQRQMVFFIKPSYALIISSLVF